MSVVLVTGAAGFLGTKVAERLHHGGYRVIGLDPAAPRAVPGWAIWRDDLSDRARLLDLMRAEAITAVVHAGGVSGPTVLPEAPAEIMRVNVANTLNLAFAALEAGAQRLVYCSSLSAVGDFFESEPIGDDPPMRPGNPYGCSKAAVDMVLRGLWGRVPLDLCSLRFTGIYGPGRRTDYPLDEIVAAAREGREAVVPPQSPWPQIYVDDAADAAVAALGAAERRQLYYNIAHPELVATETVCALVGEIAGLGRPVRSRIDAGARPSARGPVSVEAARRDFGFRARVGIREGLARMWEAGAPAGDIVTTARASRVPG